MAKAKELIISKTRTKKAVKGMNVASDTYPGLDAKVRALLQEAVKRAKANGRKTIKPQDL